MGTQLFKACKVILLTSFILAFANCSEDSGSGLRGPDPQDLDPNNFGECSQDPNFGTHLNLKEFDQRIVDSGYFRKTLKVNQLDRSLDASAKNITKILNAQGVKTYRVIENKNTSCQYYSFLEKPSSKALGNWKKFSGSDSEQNVLLGLFTTYFSRQGNGNVKLVEPTIIVRHDTQKWTILHEMTHYLFAQSRATEKNMRFSSEIKNEMEQLRNRIQNLKAQFTANENSQTATEIVKAYNRFFKLSFELDTRGPLEEFAIESMLVDRTRDALITGINDRTDMKNALAYMNSNSQIAVMSYNTLLRKLRRLRTKLFVNQDQNIKNRIKSIEQKIQNQKSFISDKLSRLSEELSEFPDFSTLPFAHPPVDHIQPHTHHFDMDLVREQHKIIDSL